MSACLGVTLVSATTGSNRCGQVGSPKHPFRTLNAAARATPPGAQIYVEPGDYYVRVPLAEKTVVASLGVNLYLEAPDVLDAILSLTGQARLYLSRPMPGLTFTQTNSSGKTLIEALSLTDTASTEATMTVQLPYRYYWRMAIRDGVAVQTRNEAILRVIGLPGDPSETNLEFETKDMIHGFGGVIVTASSGADFVFKARQLLTIGPALVINDSRAKFTVEEVGSLTQPVAMGMRGVNADIKGKIATLYAGTGGHFSGGRTQLMVDDFFGSEGFVVDGNGTQVNLTVMRLQASNRGFKIRTGSRTRVNLDVHRLASVAAPARKGIKIIHDVLPGAASSSLLLKVDRMHVNYSALSVKGPGSGVPLTVTFSGTYWRVQKLASAALHRTAKLAIWDQSDTVGDMSLALGQFDPGTGSMIELNHGTLNLFASELQTAANLVGVGADGILNINAPSFKVSGAGMRYLPNLRDYSGARVSVTATRVVVGPWLDLDSRDLLPVPLRTLAINATIKLLAYDKMFARLQGGQPIDLTHSGTTLGGAGPILTSEAPGSLRLTAQEMTASNTDAAIQLYGPADVFLTGTIRNTAGPIGYVGPGLTNLVLRQFTAIAPVSAWFFAPGNQVVTFHDGGVVSTKDFLDRSGSSPRFQPELYTILDDLIIPA